MKKTLCSIFFLFLTLSYQAHANDDELTINFNKVAMHEFVRFVSRVTGKNLVFDPKALDFEVSFVSGSSMQPNDTIDVMMQLLNQHGMQISEKGGCFVIEPIPEITEPVIQVAKTPAPEPVQVTPVVVEPPPEKKPVDFAVYKLQYHQGSEIQGAIKGIAVEDPALQSAIKSLQWIQSTNSLLYTSDSETGPKLRSIIKSLDKPLKQVFIEVLVVETDIKNGLEFGLQWAAGGSVKEKFGFGGGSFAGDRKSQSFAKAFQGVNGRHGATGPDQVPLGKGFDLGIIGDLILHKGKSFFSLATLVSALQTDGNSTIVLNQKLITQDNKKSTIFVGDNIPFTGSVVETVGASQQTTSNIEYRDVGVSLNITPLLGEDDVITLEISEEISEATDRRLHSNSLTSGIQTTKTNMVTRVHVPNEKFLVLSGMIRNHKKQQKTGLPCLGGLPFIGAAFSKKTTACEKRNVLIFVRPQIIQTAEKHEEITECQTDIYKSESHSQKDFQEALNLVDR